MAWQVKFSGSEDLAQFLEDLEELAAAHSVKEADLLTGVRGLLNGPALSWYRATKNRMTTWTAFKNLIKVAFSPGDNDDAILDRLRRMRQRDEETYVVYAARLEDQFRKLEEPLPEKQKIKFLMRGLHLFYSKKICEGDIQTESQLRRACAKWESSKQNITRKERERDRLSDQVERGKKNEGPFKESKGVGPRKRTYEECQVEGPVAEEHDTPPGDTEVAATALAPGLRRAVQCWRCGNFGHMSLQCKEEIFCVSCGMKGVVAERCQRCAEAQVRGLWKQQQTVPAQPSMQAPPSDFLTGTWSWGDQVPRMTAPSVEILQPPPPFHLPPPLRPQMQWNQEPIRPLPAQQKFQPRAAVTAPPGSHPRPGNSGRGRGKPPFL